MKPNWFDGDFIEILESDRLWIAISSQIKIAGMQCNLTAEQINIALRIAANERLCVLSLLMVSAHRDKSTGLREACNAQIDALIRHSTITPEEADQMMEFASLQ